MSRDLLFGKTPAARAPDDFAALPAETQEALDTLYDGNASQAPVGIIRGAIDQRKDELYEAGVPVEPKALGDLFTGIARESGLPDGLLMQIADFHITNLLADAAVVDDPDAEATEIAKRNDEWAREARAQLKNTYGEKDVKDIEARTRKFVNANPALKKVLQQRGLGSRPDIVTAIASHVFSSGYR
jgi:hypothetical protein